MDDRTSPQSQAPGQFRLAPALATILTFVTLTSATTVDPSQRLADDFDAAAARLEAAYPHGRMGPEHEIPPPLRVGLDRYWAEAQALAKTRGPAATGFLSAQLTQKPADIRRAPTVELALATLAALANDGDAAKALSRCVNASGYLNMSALLAVTYAPPAVARALGRDTLASRRVAPKTLAVAAPLLRLFGDDDDAEALRHAIDDLSRSLVDPRDSYNTAMAEADLVALRRRLRRPPAEQAAWATQDLLVWRAANYAWSRSRDEETGLRRNQRGLTARGRLRTDYLKDRLGTSSIGIDELRMIIWTAAEQQETTLIPDLVEIVAQERDGASLALDTLLSLGTPDALKRFIPPPSGKPADDPATGRGATAEAKRRDWILRYLSIRGGGRGYVDLLTELGADLAYPPEERAAFARGRDTARLMLAPSPGGMRSPPPK